MDLVNMMNMMAFAEESGACGPEDLTMGGQLSTRAMT
jgi:hypothetical protein